jgi:hypothetical protein
MNAKPNIRELNRIRTDIGSALRTFAEPAPQSLLALLRDLEACVRDAELEKLFAEVDARVAELLCAVGRRPQQQATAQKAENTDETVRL